MVDFCKLNKVAKLLYVVSHLRYIGNLLLVSNNLTATPRQSHAADGVQLLSLFLLQVAGTPRNGPKIMEALTLQTLRRH